MKPGLHPNINGVGVATQRIEATNDIVTRNRAGLIAKEFVVYRPSSFVLNVPCIKTRGENEGEEVGGL